MTLLRFLLAALLSVQSVFPASQETAPKQTRKPVESPQLVMDINQASAEGFAKLPGIGPALAQRIVIYRQKHGQFRRVEDLLAIRGIGHKKWKALRPYLRVNKGPEKGTR